MRTIETFPQAQRGVQFFKRTESWKQQVHFQQKSLITGAWYLGVIEYVQGNPPAHSKFCC